MQNIAKPSIAFHILHHLAGSFFVPPVVCAPYSAVYGVHNLHLRLPKDFTFAVALCSCIASTMCNAGVFVWTDFVQNPETENDPKWKQVETTWQDNNLTNYNRQVR